MNVRERIAALREEMRAEGIGVYIVPGNDPHASEYMASHWFEMQWISGFNGESGTVVVTMDRALLWTDSRYYLQAGIELKDSGIELMRESDVDCPSITEWIKGEFSRQMSEVSRQPSEVVVGVNPEMWSVDAFAELLDSHWELSKKIDAGSTNTLIDQIFDSIDDLLDGKMVCGAGGGGFLQVVLKKGVTWDQLQSRLKSVFSDTDINVWDCSLV